MNFDPFNCFLKIQKSIRTPTPKVGTHLGVCGFIPSHSPTLGSMNYDSEASLLACAFVSPCISHEPKAKIVISYIT